MIICGNLRHLRTNLFFLCALSALSVVKPSSILVARNEPFDEAHDQNHPPEPERLSDVRYKEIFTSP